MLHINVHSSVLKVTVKHPTLFRFALGGKLPPDVGQGAWILVAKILSASQESCVREGRKSKWKNKIWLWADNSSFKTQSCFSKTDLENLIRHTVTITDFSWRKPKTREISDPLKVPWLIFNYFLVG